MNYYNYTYKGVKCCCVSWGQKEDIFIFKIKGEYYFYFKKNGAYTIDDLQYIELVIDEILEKLSIGEIS